MTAPTLTRHWTVHDKPTSAAAERDAQRSEPVTGFPPVPAAAIPWLRLHLIGNRRATEPRITWWQGSGREWDAVLDLHRRGDDEAATALAVFLRWTEVQGSRADRTCWSLAPAAPAATDTSNGEKP